MNLLQLMHDSATEIRRQNTSRENLRCGHLHDVAVEHDEVGVFARSERAQLLLLKRGVCGPDRHRAKRLVASHDLIRIPSAGGQIRWILSRDRGMK